MVGARKHQAGFTLTETMVVVAIIALLAAISTPMLTRDNKARKGRGWANLVAQTLQKARFQAMGDRTNIHILLYRTHMDTYRENAPIPPQTTTTYTLLATTTGPAEDGQSTVAIWDTANGEEPLLAGQEGRVNVASFVPGNNYVGGKNRAYNEIIFTSLGGTYSNENWWIYVRNELLPAKHPDAGFVVKVGGLTGYVTSNDKWSPTE